MIRNAGIEPHVVEYPKRPPARPILINRPLVVSPLGVKLCRPSEAVRVLQLAMLLLLPCHLAVRSEVWAALATAVGMLVEVHVVLSMVVVVQHARSCCQRAAAYAGATPLHAVNRSQTKIEGTTNGFERAIWVSAFHLRGVMGRRRGGAFA